MNEELYEVSKYTDKQLYDILDISNPTDRELEARILSLIRKYRNIQNESGDKLASFFSDIYDHFFENEEEYDEDERIVQEGLENMDISTTKPPSSKNKNEDVEETDDKNESSGKDKVSTQIVTNAEYVPDKLRLNPLLKQTIKRIISIDSQYRDIQFYKNASSFSFDLSEPLRDVVSLKLYSVQIPYTWYVISKAYGANFFYLKGATNGINNGEHDYQISIKSGNYSNTELVAEVNKSFVDISNNYPDTNFNNTGLTYDTAKSITTINIDIQKSYNEFYYTFNFPFWTTSVTTDQNRLLSLASYFGFNQPTYYPHTIHSSRTYAPTSFIQNDTKRNFMFDNSNNNFKIIHYIGPQNYDPLFSTVVNTYTVTLYDSIYNSNLDRLLPVNSTVGTSIHLYSRLEIITMLNNAIKNVGIFTTDSGIYQYDISGIPEGAVANSGHTCYNLKLMMNRNKVKYNQYSKLIVIFPEEIASNYGNTTVWQLQDNISNSCFYFDNIQNEFSEIVSESTILQSSYNVGENTRIYFRCINPPYMANGYNETDFSGNDFNIVIPQGIYTLNLFVSQLNSELQFAQSIGETKGTIFSNETPFSINADSKFNFDANMLKTFTESDYTISFDENSVLCKYMGFEPQIDIDLSNTNVFQGTFDIVNSGYFLDTNYLFTINPKPDGGNQNEPANIVNIIPPEGLEYESYANYSQFLTGVITTIKDYSILNQTINDTQIPYLQTTLTSTINPSRTRVTVTMTIKVQYLLNEGNYQVDFLDGGYPITNNNNSWYPFAIDESYELYPYTINPNPPPIYFPYATITGRNIVNQNQITVTDTNNVITINPYYDASGGAYTSDNNISIIIPTGTYIITQLYHTINEAFASNPMTYGSEISTTTVNNMEYVKIRFNLNRIYTSSDYNLVFYDPFSFVKCVTGGQSVQNTTWDTTLGWILGFRSYTQYELIQSNQNLNSNFPEFPYYLLSYSSVYKYRTVIDDKSNLVTNTIINFSGDTTTTTTLYNYFVIALDDFNQNHLNDGLVTITRQQNSIQMPDYSASSTKVCDPVIGKVVNRPNTNIDNQLTQNQIYSLNQAAVSQQATTKTYSAGPYIKDLFGFIPIKSGTNGTYFIEYGGGLQSQERMYFGPVNIRKMNIQLMNDRGDLVDLNGSNWSFSFIMEQLYRSGSSGSSK